MQVTTQHLLNDEVHDETEDATHDPLSVRTPMRRHTHTRADMFPCAGTLAHINKLARKHATETITSATRTLEITHRRLPKRITAGDDVGVRAPAREAWKSRFSPWLGHCAR